MVLGHVKLSETQAAAGSMESFVLMNWILLSNTQFYSSNLIIEDCIYILTLKTFIQKQFFKIVLTTRKMGNNDAFYASRNVKDDVSLKRRFLPCHSMFYPTMALLGSAIFGKGYQ